MAAGLGFKTFVTGEVLTAGDTNGYLMQGINVFASAAARDAAITAPAEGQFAFTKDTNGLWYYDGAAWVASGATGDIEGVTAGIGISGGGTSGTVTVTNSMATAIDAKGDLVAGTGADTFSRLAVGANNTVLTADSAEATGLKWATPAGAKNFSLLNTGGTALTGADTITISGISSMDQLMIVVQGASITTTTGTTDISLRFNADSGSNYRTSFVSYTSAFNTFGVNGSSVTLGSVGAGGDVLDGYLFMSGGATSGLKVFQGAGGGDDAASNRWRWFGGAWTGSAITSISIVNTTGGGSPNFDAGTIYVYGAA